MALWLWTFWTYSFLGYLLEGAYDAVTGQGPVRKGALLLPICPVYGLGALAVLSLPPALTGGFWSRALWGGLAATAAEYGIHLLYDRLLGVRFWDYARFPGNLRGRVCLPFSLAWGLLAAAVLPPIQSLLAPLAEQIPPAVTYGALLVFTADTAVSLRLLAGTGDPASLSLRELLPGRRPPVTAPAVCAPATGTRPHRPSPGPPSSGSHGADRGTVSAPRPGRRPGGTPRTPGGRPSPCPPPDRPPRR